MGKNNSLKTLITGAVLAAGIFLVSPTVSQAKSFVDLGVNGSHTEAVNYLNSIATYDYKTGNKLNGNSTVTRGEVSKVLYNLYKDELTPVRATPKFLDVTSKTPYAKEINWSYEVGIFDGSDGNKFKPADGLSRAAVSKILVNTFKLESNKTTSFKDVKSSHWAYKYVSILGSKGISKGDGKGNFMPNNRVTLNQLSSFIYRIAGKDTTTNTNTGSIKPPAVTELKNPTLEQIKELAIGMFNNPDKYSNQYTFETKDDILADAFIEYSFLKVDMSQAVNGYVSYGPQIQIDNYKLGDTWYNTLEHVNNREESEQLDWNNRMDKAEKYIVDNYPLNTEYEVVKAIYEFTASQIEYGEWIPDDSPFLVHRNNATTCTGYADVMAELLNRFGIKARYVTGSVHAWNAVYLNNNWYYTDATYGDTSTQMDKYLLFTQAEREQDFSHFDSSFRASNVPFDPSTSKAYTYKNN